MRENNEKRRLVLESRAEEGLGLSYSFHMLPFVEQALHLNEPDFNLDGKKVLLMGLPKGRARVAERAKGRGAHVTEIGMEKIATNAKKPFQKKLPELSAPHSYDEVVSYLGTALYARMPFPPIFRKQSQAIDDALSATDFENGGECHFVVSDFTETLGKAKKDRKVERALNPVMKFMKVSGMNPFQAQTLRVALEKRIQNKQGLKVFEKINERPEGRQYWTEIRDLYLMLEQDCKEAVKELQEAPKPIRAILASGFIKQMKLFNAKLSFVDTILDLPLEQRPIVRPPLSKTFTIKRESVKKETRLREVLLR